MFNRKLEEHRVYTREQFVDLPEIANWRWTPDFSDPTAPPPAAESGSTKSFTDA
jgi:xylulose-5-phosphate/fructose-6-phosphate phosphoketolase